MQLPRFAERNPMDSRTEYVKKKYNLFTNIYSCCEPRMKEIIECLNKNILLGYITTITLIVEDDSIQTLREKYPILNHSKIKIIDAKRRITYSEYMEYSNSDKHSYAIIANNDIYFDESLAYLQCNSNTFCCLTRWEVNPLYLNSRYQYLGCYDSYIYKAPIRKLNCNWTSGVLGCDVRLAYEAFKGGMDVINPSSVIKSYHLHHSGVRNYRFPPKTSNDIVEGMALNVPCTSSFKMEKNILKIFYHNIKVCSEQRAD